jgi:hypothetical protein
MLENKSWYVIHGNEHLKIGSFSDATTLMEKRIQNHPGEKVIVMDSQEYNKWPKRKTKRGKKSK